MDQCPFEFKITIIGCEVDDFIENLLKLGYDEQAKSMENQFINQLNNK
jgi:hypothetical protein